MADAPTIGTLRVTRAHRPDNTGGYDYAVSDCENRVIAEFFEHVGHDGKGGYVTLPALANATLYANASEVLDVLIDLVNLIDDTRKQDSGAYMTFHRADAVIAKAIGRIHRGEG